MKLCLLSDLHIEFSSNGQSYIRKFIPKTKTNDILILAGDIGNPSKNIYTIFITEVSKYYDKVFVIAGNHEYYEKNKKTFDHITQKIVPADRPMISDVNKIIDDLCNSLPNVYFMNRRSVVHDRVRFLGCTLWTRSDKELSQYMNDYNYIPEFTSEVCEKMHHSDIMWLESQLKLPNDGTYDKTVVMTHHVPTTSLIDKKYQNNLYNIFYVDDLDYLVRLADIWVCGHTHTAAKSMVGKCRCYVNPKGYNGETSYFDPNMKIEVFEENTL